MRDGSDIWGQHLTENRISNARMASAEACLSGGSQREIRVSMSVLLSVLLLLWPGTRVPHQQVCLMRFQGAVHACSSAAGMLALGSKAYWKQR